ncbi:hypothetical protein I6F26_28410 [Ensifer sp. IC3342]|nr:hypothetical protein [Ensifer sp. BRP08]MCA1450471.1 hypothetical protein [Ensifer sp. IC3342]
MLTDIKRFKREESRLLFYARFGQPDLRPLAHGATIQIVDTENRQRETVQRIRKLTGKGR